MAQPKPFTITDKLLRRHAAGVVLCLATSANGRSFLALADAPTSTSAIPWRKSWSRRRDFLGWAPARTVSAKVARDPDDDPDSDDPDSSDSLPTATGDEAVQGVTRTVNIDATVRVLEIRGVLASVVERTECGFIDGYDGAGGIVDRFSTAAYDPACCAVVIDADSPGGMAKGCGEAAAAMARIAADCGKPVLVYAREACSAMYFLAALAAPGGIYVSESSDVGCIGSRCVHVDRSGSLEQDGIKVTHIADPPGKALGNADEPLADEARARLVADVGESSRRFAAAMAAARPGLSLESIKALNGDTRRGAVAVAEGLADGMASGLEEVVALAYSLAASSSSGAPTTSPGAQAPSPEEGSMQLSPEMIRAIGLDPTTKPTDAAQLAAIAPRLALASATLGLLNETDPIRALSALPRAFDDAAAAPALREQLGVKSADAEEAKREALITDAVTDGRLRAGMAWDQVEKLVDGKTVRAKVAKPYLATQTLDQLTSYLTGLPKLATRTAEEANTVLLDAADARRGAVALTQRDREQAQRAGVDPNQLAAALAARGHRPAEEGA